jgi:lipoprotein-anchoring transpeptidase ErfK/SrfK
MFRRILACALFTLLASPALAANISITVDISTQTMSVAVDGVPTYDFDVSTGRKGHATPTGRYGVERMYRKYNSIKYDNAPMPYAIFFHGGYAIHGTTDIKHLGRIASHGCVRLHPENARLLFDLVNEAGSGHTSIRVMS